MACDAVHSWTVSLFIASFLKLTLAFLLLWVAWVSFVTAKFLSFFGLHLPCTCNDFIEDQNSGVENICVQAALMDCPSRMISTTGSSVLHRFPFGGVCTHEGSCSSSTLNTRAVSKRSIGGPFDRSSAGRKILSSDPCHWNSVGPEDWRSINRRASLDTQDMQTEITEVKSDYCSCHAVEQNKVCCRQGRCSHCFGNSFHNNENCRWSSKWKVNQGTLHDGEASPSGLHVDVQNTAIGEGGTRSIEDRVLINELPGGSDAYATSKEKIELTSEDWCQLERTLSLIDLDGLVNSGEERGEQGDLLKALDSAAREQISQGDKQDVLKDIIEALGAEREARKALYLELEKERSAAETAAEETMAMISRLQKEKASIEMEARQFKRMAEEKLVYDEEAIEILKEILVRREREKLDLEDEVDMYRQSLLRDGTDKWERKSCNESEEYCKDNNKPSLQEAHESMLQIGREFDCFERQKTGADENISLNMDVRPRVEKQLDNFTDKLHGKSKHVAPFDGRDLLKSFDLVANENPLNGTDKHQVPQIEGNMISFASQDPKGKDFLENENQELVKPIKAAVDKDPNQQQDDRKDLLEQMNRSEEQPGLMLSREARVMNSFVEEGGLQREKYFSERNSFEILSQQEYDDMKGSLNGDGLYKSDVGRLHRTEDICDHTLENDSSTRDVHVVLDNIHTSPTTDSEDTKVSSLKASDGRDISGLLQSFAEQGKILLTVQNNVLMQSNSPGISSSYENANPSSSESKASKTGLDLKSGYLHKNILERTSSPGLHVKSLLLRDNARMKVENDLECLAGRLRALEASRENAILPVENLQKEKAQVQHLEEVTQHHRDMQTSEDGLKYA